MNFTKLRMVGLGVLLGSVACTVFAMPALVPRSFADEQPLKSMYAAKDAVSTALFGPDLGDLAKPQWTLDDSVSTEVLSSQRIKKIEYGRTSYVTIATTASGVYSSDGLESPHFRYPGIDRTGDGGDGKGMLSELVLGQWKVIHEVGAGSFVSVTPFDGGNLVVTEDGACVFTKTAAYC